MARSRSFSIYLLKESFNGENTLKDEHGLDEVTSALLPEGATIFVLDNVPYPPWWKDYFKIEEDLTQVTKGAMVFLPVAGRTFALCFGHVAHNLKEESYEYDFGLRVTLNCVDPKELRSTDSLDPGVGRRQRTQLPIGSDLTLFDFDKDSSVLRRLTGKVKAEHRELFKQATGASNLRVNSDASANNLGALCEKLLNLYHSDAYKEIFNDIQNIVPVRDPVLIAKLDQKLVEAVRAKDDALALVIPDMVDYDGALFYSFSGAGPDLQYEDLFMARYYEYLERREVDLNTIGIDQLKGYRLIIEDENGVAKDRHRVHMSLIFDTTLDGASFHLSEGHWYKVESEYVKKIEEYLDPFCVGLPLPAYEHKTEGEYNEAITTANEPLICLDETSISPDGQTAIEPCDIYYLEEGFGVFCHVKVSTLSAKLSHLFNQGANPIQLLRLDAAAMEKLKALLKEKAGNNSFDELTSPLDQDKLAVIFAIVTHKNKDNKSKNIPLFSRISLMRNMKSLQAGHIRGRFGFIEDRSPKGATKKKPRKKKAA